MANYRICVIDDESGQARQLSAYLNDAGFETVTFNSGPACLRHLQKHYADLIISDLKMPEMSGLELLKEVKALNPDIAVILVTAFGSVEDAVRAMRDGAEDFLTKPIDLDELDLRLEKIFEHRLLLAENRLLKEQLQSRTDNSRIIYKSTEMEEVLNLVARVSESQASILIQGESGTGKEMIAQAIHQASDRSRGNFVAVNCAAIPETLFESEFFGHEKGAFTGANERKTGRIELASGGTLFLDEVADIPPTFQVKLLRVLQNGDYQRLGSAQTLQANVRVISATNKDVAAQIRDGLFRADLYYRLNVVSIDLPALRNRRDDIPILAGYFVGKHAERNRRPVRGLSPEATAALMTYDFPGNVRELENMVERAVILTRNEYLLPGDFLLQPIAAEPAADAPGTGSLPEQIEALEQRLIVRALNDCAGIQTRAADQLGITERNLRYKMQKYHIDRRNR